MKWKEIVTYFGQKSGSLELGLPSNRLAMSVVLSTYWLYTFW